MPFDLTFWVLITVVGLNIVFTVIVGNFALLREERAEIEEDLKRVCMICRWVWRTALGEITSWCGSLLMVWLMCSCPAFSV